MILDTKCHWTEQKKLFCSRPKKSYQSLQHLHKDSNMTAFINQQLVVVQLVIKPWWKDWPSLMEFLIDILVDVDVGGWHLKVPTSSNVFPPFFLVVFTGPNKFVPWIIIICIKMHEKTHLLSYLDVYFIPLHNAISFIYYGLESEWGKLMA